MNVLKRLASTLPGSWRSELRRHYYRRQIRRDRFASREAEYRLLPEMLSTGDWVIDVGANVGHYTKHFSELVGEDGRVIAIEPVPRTFALLAANCRHFAHANVTLIASAVSNRAERVGIAVPDSYDGLRNYYRARLSADSSEEKICQVTTLRLDSLEFPHRIALVKIDTEGHEGPVLEGISALLERDRPILIIETNSEEIAQGLRERGYESERLPGSSNLIFRPRS